MQGMHDGFFPAEDNLIPLDYGWPKLARLYPDQGHMGGEAAFGYIQQWLESVMWN